MNGPPATLLRLMRFLGSESSRNLSRGWCWSSLVIGVANHALFVGLWVSSSASDHSKAFSRPMASCLSLMLALQGASGLLRESREGLSLWLSAIYGLIFLPLVLLTGAFLYAWVGYPRVGAWAVFLVLLEMAIHPLGGLPSSECPGGGMTPICCSMPTWSMRMRLSTTLPLAMRSSAIPHTSTRPLVGGTCVTG